MGPTRHLSRASINHSGSSQSIEIDYHLTTHALSAAQEAPARRHNGAPIRPVTRGRLLNKHEPELELGPATDFVPVGRWAWPPAVTWSEEPSPHPLAPGWERATRRARARSSQSPSRSPGKASEISGPGWVLGATWWKNSLFTPCCRVSKFKLFSLIPHQLHSFGALFAIHTHTHTLVGWT